MKVKVVSKGDVLVLPRPLRLVPGEVEIEIPEEYLIQEEEKQPFCKAIWETIGSFPEEPVDWEKAWHKHLEEKYRGQSAP